MRVFHVGVKIQDGNILITPLISRRRDLPVTELTFDTLDEPGCPVYVYWRSEQPDDSDPVRVELINRRILAYVKRLSLETAYAGPDECCL
jgi:hypothetical protein